MSVITSVSERSSGSSAWEGLSLIPLSMRSQLWSLLPPFSPRPLPATCKTPASLTDPHHFSPTHLCCLCTLVLTHTYIQAHKHLGEEREREETHGVVRIVDAPDAVGPTALAVSRGKIRLATMCLQLLQERAVRGEERKREERGRERDCEHNERPITLDQAVVQDYVFGFGSLINTASRVSSDRDAVAAIPVRVSASVGYARSWNFQHPTEKLTALGLEKTEAGAGRTINGVVYPVLSASGMEALDKREIGYTRVAIATGHLKPLSWQTLPDGARVWMYVPLGPAASTATLEAGEDNDDEARAGVGLTGPSFHNPILQSYVDVCILGCLEYSEEFAREFVTSTSLWDGPWINDRQIPRRPWLHQPRYEEIDALLAAVIPEAFGRRRLPEEYSVEMMAAIAPQLGATIVEQFFETIRCIVQSIGLVWICLLLAVTSCSIVTIMGGPATIAAVADVFKS